MRQSAIQSISYASDTGRDIGAGTPRRDVPDRLRRAEMMDVIDQSDARARSCGTRGVTGSVSGSSSAANGRSPGREANGRSSGGGVAGSQEVRLDQLLSAVENELIPRLLICHSSEVAGAAANDMEDPVAGPWAGDECVRDFAMLCIEDTSDILNRRVSDLLSRGTGLDAVYLHLIAPVARYLGDLWTEDELSFVDVQIGLSRLHRLVCECGTVGFQKGDRGEGEGEPFSILLSTVPGDQHTFGVTLAADFFRRYGWQVSNLAGLDRSFLLDRVSSTPYSAVGFSLHNEDFADDLPSLIRTVRERSRNRGILVLVGGDYFVRNQEMAVRVGADMTASDAHRAVVNAEATLRSGATKACKSRGE